MLKDLIQTIEFNIQINLPAIRVSDKTVKEVLDENEIFTLDDFTEKLGYKDPLKNFRDIYEQHAFQKGFKNKRSKK